MSILIAIENYWKEYVKVDLNHLSPPAQSEKVQT